MLHEIFCLSTQATLDLDEIWLFIAQDNVEAVDRFHDLLLSKFILLSKKPFIGKVRKDIHPEILSFPVESYIIFYTAHLDYLEIIRVLHGAQDIVVIKSLERNNVF